MLGPIDPERKTGDEPFTQRGMPTAARLADFWAWNQSDLVNNTLRGARTAPPRPPLVRPTQGSARTGRPGT